MILSLLTSWRKRLQGPPARAALESLPSNVQFAMQFNQRPGLTLVLGDTRAGKSTLLKGAAKQLQGCVIHLQLTSQSLNGWDDAPFYGLFTPDRGVVGEADLPDVLRSRHPGLFQLEMPKDVMMGDSGQAQLVRTRLGELLRQPLMDSVPHSQSFRLVLLVDSGEHILCDKALKDLLRYGRSANCHLVLALQGTSMMSDRFREDVKHLVAFKSSDPQVALIEQLFEDPRVQLGVLTPGQFWHKVVPTAEIHLHAVAGSAQPVSR